MPQRPRKRRDYITEIAAARQLFFVEQWLKWLPTWTTVEGGSLEEAAMIVEQWGFMKQYHITTEEMDEAYRFACRLLEVKP